HAIQSARTATSGKMPAAIGMLRNIASPRCARSGSNASTRGKLPEQLELIGGASDPPSSFVAASDAAAAVPPEIAPPVAALPLAPLAPDCPLGPALFSPPPLHATAAKPSNIPTAANVDREKQRARANKSCRLVIPYRIRNQLDKSKQCLVRH